MIELHYTATPNGQKIAIMLEEAQIPYTVKMYDIFQGDQHAPGFEKINPNRKLPAIVDLEPADGTGPLAVFESGAILQYLAEKSGTLLPSDPRGRFQVIQWLTWQVAGLGPMGGQASHFLRYAPAGQDYAIERYTKEMERLLGVLEARLQASPYLGGDDYSIADIAVWPGQAASFALGADPERYKATYDWFRRIEARPAINRLRNNPDLAPPAKYMGRHQKLTPEEWSNMFSHKQG